MHYIWQRRRSEFNHDWLQNQYMPALASCLNLLEGRTEDRELEETFVSAVLPQWELYRDEAADLIKEFVGSMSPKNLFYYEPLSNVDEITKGWLGILVHTLWIARYPVNQWADNAAAALDRVNKTYRCILDDLKYCPDTQSAMGLQPYTQLFKELREGCQDLADAMSKFPREILLA
jgi:hypothetical protein